jgi:hypothetical protein
MFDLATSRTAAAVNLPVIRFTETILFSEFFYIGLAQ